MQKFFYGFYWGPLDDADTNVRMGPVYFNVTPDMVVKPTV